MASLLFKQHNMTFRDYFMQYPKLGKIIGTTLGFLMAGPVGAFLGLFVGNFFDKGLFQHFAKPHAAYRNETETTVKLYFLKSTFASIGYIGKADGRITETLIKEVQNLMNELGLSLAEKKLAQAFFRAGKDATTAISVHLLDFRSIAPQHTQLLKLSAELMYRAAKIGGLSHAKIIRLNEVFYLIGLAPLNTQQTFQEDFFYRHQYRQQQHEQHQHPSRPHTTSIDEAYAILQISPKATEAEIKKRYRRLMSQHHPDKLIAKKATPKEIKLANEKTQAISKAYESICKYRGW